MRRIFLEPSLSHQSNDAYKRLIQPAPPLSR